MSVRKPPQRSAIVAFAVQWVTCLAITGVMMAPASAAEPRDGQLLLEEIRFGEAIALLVILGLAIWCVVFGARMLQTLRDSKPADRILFRHHWGGFGGDSSGWQVSTTLGTAVLGVMLISVGISLASGTLYVLHQHDIVKPPPPATASSTSSTRNDASGAGADKPAVADKSKKQLTAAPPSPAQDDQTTEEPARAPGAPTGEP